MTLSMRARYLGLILLVGCLVCSVRAAEPSSQKLCVSGVYPHLAVFNKTAELTAGEVGIGAAVPWAGKLWLITYPPHYIKGSPGDKLYSIDSDLNMTIHPESVGGTHANRMIHTESNQLIIGPYFIDSQGKVRVVDISKMVGRLTGNGRHLTDPVNKVYFYEMEGAMYEVDVHTLAVTKLFERCAPGAHGKGAYTAQGRFIIANNGDKGPTKGNPAAADPADPKDPEVAGALAEWDGKKWTVIERHQFTDVTGLGGINGSPDANSPAWAIGWDKRSVILKLLDGGSWSTFRMPKASHAFDPKHGWYTEWPRIREAAPGKLMMVMHGMMLNFPSTFSARNTAGISPIASHLRYIPDFCHWNGKLILATDETTIMANPMAGQPESNLWFGTMEDLKSFGPASGWGGPWVHDAVKANEPSAAYLINGFDRKVVHLYHDALAEVKMILEADIKGDGNWTAYATVAVPAKGYAYHIFPAGFSAQWIRVKADRDCTATAYFHYTAESRPSLKEEKLFAALAEVKQGDPCWGLIRPAAHNRNLQFLVDGKTYMEVDEKLQFTQPGQSLADEVTKIAAIKKDFEVDDASVIMTLKGKRYRLPKGDAAFDKPLAGGWPRGIREVESERNLMNIHGTFYEMPRENGLPLIKPVASHNKQIMDFCTWRGLLVLSGCASAADSDGHRFAAADGKSALWFGAIDDLWKLGEPVGHGGPWAKTKVKAATPSDPYLMTNYARKRVELSHDSSQAVKFMLEVDVDHQGWKTYQTFDVPAGKTVTHEFPDGFNAHWVRTTADHDCAATAFFIYER